MILNNKSNRHSKETIARVKQAAEELGYHPNLRAKSLRLDRSYAVGLVLPDIANPFYPEIAKQLDEYLKQRGYSMLLLNSNEAVEEEERFFRMYRGRLLDGMIVFTRNSVKLQDVCKLKADDCAVFMDDVDRKIMKTHPVVATDNENGGYMLGSYLLEMGHRNIAFIGGYTNSDVTMGRLNGYRQAFEEVGLKIPDRNVFFYDFSEETARVALERLNLKEITAIACVNDIMAHQVIGFLTAQGYRVPEDLSVTGYDHLEINRFMGYRLTTVEQFPDRLAEKAVELLMQRLEDREQNAGLHLVEPELVEGTTVRQIGTSVFG